MQTPEQLEEEVSEEEDNALQGNVGQATSLQIADLHKDEQGLTIGNLKAVADAQIDGRDGPDKNRGDGGSLKPTKTRDAGLIAFDLTDLEGATIESVKLRLYCYDKAWNEPRPVSLWSCGSFEEMNVTWNNKPSAGQELVSGVKEGIPGWWEFQSDALTNYVKSNLGSKIYLAVDYAGGSLYESKSSVHYGVRFSTKEKSAEEAPTLELTGEAPPSNPVNNIVDRVSSIVQDNPMEVGIGAAAVGVAGVLYTQREKF